MTPTTELKTISPGAAYQLLQTKPGARLIDVRTRAEYDQIHAEAAIHIPMEELTPKAVETSDKPLLLICKSGARATQCANRLNRDLTHPVQVIEGGTEAWAQAGLPVVEGNRQVLSLERQVRIAVGSLVLTFSILALTVDTRFAALPAFFGAGLLFAGLTDWCGLGLVLARMPWNR